MNKKVFLSLTLACGLAPALTYAVPGTLKPLKGSTYIQHPNKDLWESVKSPVAVEEGDRIKTNNDSMAFLTMPDDHRVAIGPESYLVLQRMAEGETKIYLKNGSIRNKVRHLNLDLGQYYKVQTPAAVCAVRGTDFTVLQNVGSKTSEVHVFEGIVDLSALRKDMAKETTRLEAGHTASIDAKGNVQHLTTNATAGSAPQPHNGQPASTLHGTTGDNSQQPHQGPPPPGTGGTMPGMPGGTPPSMPGGTSPNMPGGTGPVWYQQPDTITPDTFKPTSLLPPTMMPVAGQPGTTTVEPPYNGPANGEPPTAEGGTTPPNLPPAQGPEPTNFNPISGTGINTGPTGTSGPTTTVTYNPPPTGSNPPPPTTTIDPTAAGNAALFATIQNMNLQSQLQGLLVAGLFQDGSVKLSPIDGQWHLYADAIQKNATNDGIAFLNATMTYNQPNTLNYQIGKIQFNQVLPANPSAYSIATQTAFRQAVGTPTGTPYYATTVDNYRSNTVDYVDVSQSGGTLAPDTSGRLMTVFNSGQCTVNGTVLWANNNGIYTYLGGSKPTLQFSSGSGMASSALNNTYSNGDYLGRQVVYFDPSTGQIASAATIPAGVSPQQYFGGTYLVAQDTLYSNLFSKPGGIMAFGSAQSRVLGGIDSVVNDQDALSILNGAMPFGAPDGLLHS